MRVQAGLVGRVVAECAAALDPQFPSSSWMESGRLTVRDSLAHPEPAVTPAMALAGAGTVHGDGDLSDDGDA